MDITLMRPQKKKTFKTHDEWIVWKSSIIVKLHFVPRNLITMVGCFGRGLRRQQHAQPHNNRRRSSFAEKSKLWRRRRGRARRVEMKEINLWHSTLHQHIHADGDLFVVPASALLDHISALLIRPPAIVDSFVIHTRVTNCVRLEAIKVDGHQLPTHLITDDYPFSLFTWHFYLTISRSSFKALTPLNFHLETRMNQP